MSVTDELTADVTVSSLVSALSTDYFILASSAGEFEASSEANVGVDEVTKMIGYFKASNAGANDYFGNSIALSDDGTTLAIGAPYEDNSATGVITDGSETTDVGAASGSGAVYLFSHNSGKWVQTAYVKASNTGNGDFFGYSIALSDDGTTLAVGALYEGNSATGVITDGSEIAGDVSTVVNSGAVYLFNNSGGTWTQIAYVKASNTGSDDNFGHSLALSADGTALAVGAIGETNSATGVTDGSVITELSTINDAGAVYLFSNSSGAWAQTAYVKASNTDAGDQFGYHIALSDDGSTLAVAALGEDNSEIGVITDGSESPSNGGGDVGLASYSGAVYLFSNSSGTWAQIAYVKASNTEALDRFGYHIALSGDGNTLAVGASSDDNGFTGILTDGSESPSNGGGDVGAAYDSGAVYLFSKSGGTWAQTAYVKASNTGSSDCFGCSIALSDDGATLVVGAFKEDNRATGIIIDSSEETGDVNTDFDTGAVYLFSNSSGDWAQTAYVKASNTGGDQWFSSAVALSGDGETLAIGAPQELNSATGIITDGSENSDTGTAANAGAVYIY
jgi:hypothetical protein